MSDPSSGLEEQTRLPVEGEATATVFEVPVTVVPTAEPTPTRSDAWMGNAQVTFYQGLTSGDDVVATPSLIATGHAQPAVRRAVIEDTATVPQVVRVFHHPEITLPSAVGVTAIPLADDAATASAQLAAAELTPRDVILLPDIVQPGLEDQWRPAAGARTPILVVPMATRLSAEDLNPLAAIASALDGRVLRVRPETILRAGLEGRDIFSVQY